jgi:aerobic-type carbon monoxide dehydrogenase small subunit (CoxS/CutS family)
MIERRPVTITINGRKVGPVEVPIGMPMIDFLHEYLNLTGTRFGCGQGICHACTVMELDENGNATESRTCIYDAHYFDGKSIRTIEGHAEYDADGQLKSITPVQQAFIEHFSFQCGYCTPGFVTGATVFIENLKKSPVRRAELEKAIEDALNIHICRCTGYVRYYEAVKAVALSTPGCVID